MKFVLAAVFALVTSHAFAHGAPVEHVHLGGLITIAAPVAALLALLLVAGTVMMALRNAQSEKMQRAKIQPSETHK